MKVKFTMLVTAMIVLSLGTLHAQTPSKPAGGFDRLKVLAGEWQGPDESGKPVTSTFRLVSNDTALEETFQSDKDKEMVTVYTPDGTCVTLTHYCSKANQPKMECPAVRPPADEFAFTFTRAPNLASPE